VLANLGIFTFGLLSPAGGCRLSFGLWVVVLMREREGRIETAREGRSCIYQILEEEEIAAVLIFVLE
jgi:hypothetical protein